jgi:hypothetical protein
MTNTNKIYEKAAWSLLFVGLIAATFLCYQLSSTLKAELKFQSDWASFYCTGKEVEYVGDLRPHLGIQKAKGHIERVFVMCQGDIK